MFVVHYLANSHSQRILWLLEELDIPYDTRRYQREPETGLAPPEFKATHPLGMSSVITDNGKVAAGSGAIINYILREYAGGRLQPDTAEGSFDDYAYSMHAADASAMPAHVIRLNVAQVDANASVLTRLDAEITDRGRHSDQCFRRACECSDRSHKISECCSMGKALSSTAGLPKSADLW